MAKEFGFHRWSVVAAFLVATLQSAIASAESTIPIKVRDHGRLLAPVALNRKGEYTFLLDTGATTTVISEKLATKIGITGEGTAPVHTFAGLVALAVGRVDSFQIGNHSVEGKQVLIGDLGRLFRLDAEVEGIMGQDVLSTFNYVLDRRHRKLEIEDNGNPGTAPSGTRVPFERRGGKIYVQAGALRLMLDSGNPYLVLYEDVARDLHPVTINSDGPRAVSSFVGQRRILMARIPALRIGDKLLRNLEVLLTARQAGRYEDGFLPLHFFDSIYVNNFESFLIINPTGPGSIVEGR